MREVSQDFFYRCIIGKQLAWRSCALALALFVCSRALAIDAASTDHEIELCGERGRIPDGPKVGVYIRRVTGQHDSDLHGLILVSENAFFFPSMTYQIRVGDAISIGGVVYQVDELIYDKAGHGINESTESRSNSAVEKIVIAGRPIDCMKMHANPNPIFRPQKGALVVQKRPGSVSFQSSPKGKTTLFLDRVSRTVFGQAATVTWQSGPRNSWLEAGDPGQNAPSLHVNRVTLRENAVFVLPGVGQFRIVKIIPEGSHQPAWLVMEPGAVR